jgi:multidrug resistance efflux pump
MTVIPVESTSVPTSVEMMLAQIDAAQAARDTAAANLAIVKNGARVEQVQAAQAQVDAAQAQVDFFDVQIKKATITAPSDGFILTRSVEVGQTALPGGTLLEVGYLDLMDLTIYLPENQLGAAQIGQPVNVTTNAFPNRSFKGTVLRIASEAEFTPGNVQSKEDRSRLVYAVTIQLKNSVGALKPGMIGDVTFP